MYNMELCLKLKVKFKNNNKIKGYQVKWNLIKLLSNQIIQHKNTLYLLDFKVIRKDSENYFFIVLYFSQNMEPNYTEKVKKVKQQLCG